MWTILLAGAALLFAVLYLLLRQSIQRATEQVRQITISPPTNQITRLHSPDKQLEGLLVEINRLLIARQSDRILHEQEVEQMRRQMVHISHDLRTPLTAMIGYAELLGEQQLSEEAAMYLLVVEKRAKVLRQLINSLYELSRLDAGDYPLQLQKVDLQVVLQRALAEYYTEFTNAGFQVTLELTDTATAGYVIADEDGVMRVYMNVLQNVLKHGQRSLHVFQGIQAGRVTTIIKNETVRLQAEDLPHLFERSYTSDQSRAEGNSGLGLAVVQGLMEQMSGQAHAAYDEPVFTLTLDWGRGQVPGTNISMGTVTGK